VETATARQARRVRRIEYAARIAKQRLCALNGLKLQESLWADSGPTGKQSLQVMFAQTHVRGHVGERRLRLTVVREKGKGRLDPNVVLGIHGALVRLAGYSEILAEIYRFDDQPPTRFLRPQVGFGLTY